MADMQPTHKDRTFAAAAGISATPQTTPPDTPTRHHSESRKHPEKKFSLPLAAYTIIFVEGCERFCYYGLKAVLLLYLMQFLRLSKDSATVGYHLFSFACYFTPTIGAILSDGYIGRYWTIVILSIIYLGGTLILTLTAIPALGGKTLAGPIVGLLLISFGTGGIKPCVSTFGADQISLNNPKALSRYFSFFYFAINFGSVISTIITPVLRSQVQCFGYDCYALAFGIPGFLVFTAIVIFLLGTPLYKRVPPKENIIARFVAVIFHAIRNSLFGSQSHERKEHWVYHADDKYGPHDIEDVRSVLRVFLLLTPIPIFFALYDQSGSRWTYQASLMDGNLGPLGTIEPDQMQALNSILVLILIPLFEEVIYPAFARYKILEKPLKRMICGMVVMIFAFIAAGTLQAAIEIRADSRVIRTHTQIFNGYSCPININANETLEPREANFPCSKLFENRIFVTSTCDQAKNSYKLSTNEPCPTFLTISQTNDHSNGTQITITPFSNAVSYERIPNEYALLRLVSLDGKQTTLITIPNRYKYDIEQKLFPTEYQPVLGAEYQLRDGTDKGRISVEKFKISTTAVYSALTYTTNDNKLHVTVFEDARSHKVHMLWQTVQYLLLTIAEILVSITGLVFAYSQSPKRYKSVIMSAWLFTTAIGDLIVAVVAEARAVRNQSIEFFLFSGLMTFGAVVFAALVSFYKEYIPPHHESEDQQLIISPNAIETEDEIQLSK
ncbi:unnamed protein product [Rotaria socialis]|uniref:Uncharacterized protein n=1 Tax=Rotaria socialis TaxID=392032 RepID=A0A820G7B7_9BILA|nr:unnamed protein product [Rotaria socialis]CAF4761588.1 unnamed protein product [Rotaria socialis]